MTRRRARTAILVGIVPILVAGDAAARSPRDGLRHYLERDDRRAFAVLQEDLDAAEIDPRTALALGDLAFMRRDFATAREALGIAAALGGDPIARQARIWRAWVDFEDGDLGAAEGRLRHIIATEPGAIGDEAALTLGWQQLIADRAHEAARTFASLATPHAGHWVAFPDHALLLEGQARLFAGDLDGADDAFARLATQYPSSPLRDDADRDRAWCRHLRGDHAGARAGLEAVISAYGGPHFAGDAVRGLPTWPTVVGGGPRALGRATWRSYRRRPRGEPPLPFLLRLVDRSAVADARALLVVLAEGRSPAASGRVSERRRDDGDPGTGPPGGAVARSDGRNPTQRSETTGAAAGYGGRTTAIVLIAAALLIAGYSVSRRRKR